jgi:hypothetical protein
MDKQAPAPEGNLLEVALAATRAHGLAWEQVRRRPGVDIDAMVRLRHGADTTTYHVEVKRAVQPAVLGATLAQLKRLPAPALLVADYVTPPMADRLREKGVQFIDAAGNAFVQQPPVLVWVKGQRPLATATAVGGRGRAFQATGLQVLFTLLCKPEIVDRPYREIATLAGVAHGTVGWVMPELPRLGFVGTLKGHRRLLNGPKLLQQWAEAYARTLRPKLALERWRAEALDWTARIDPTRYGLLLGGEPAAQRLTGQLLPGTATFYGDTANRKLMIDQRLHPDPAGNVELLRRFWAFDGETPGQVPDLLVYADLLAIGDARCLEAAEEMHDGIVARFE